MEEIYMRMEINKRKEQERKENNEKAKNKIKELLFECIKFLLPIITATSVIGMKKEDSERFFNDISCIIERGDVEGYMDLVSIYVYDEFQRGKGMNLTEEEMKLYISSLISVKFTE